MGENLICDYGKEDSRSLKPPLEDWDLATERSCHEGSVVRGEAIQ